VKEATGTRHNDNFLAAYRTYVCSLVVCTLSNSLTLNPPRPAEISRPASRHFGAPLRATLAHRRIAMRQVGASLIGDAPMWRIANRRCANVTHRSSEDDNSFRHFAKDILFR